MGETGTPTDHVATTMRVVLLGVTAAVQFGLCLPQVLRFGGAAAWTAFTVLALVTAACGVWAIRRKPLPTGVSSVGVVVVLCAASLATSAVPPDGFFRAPHWSFGLVGWHLLLLLLDRVPTLLTAFAAHLVVDLAWFALASSPDRAQVGEAGAVALSTTGFQLAVVVITRMLRRSARQAAEAAAEQDRVTTRMALAEQWGQDQKVGFAGQLGGTLPLLAGIADGVLDPRVDTTRSRCALAATQLRRLFAENDDVPDPLVHEVSACVDVAERRGLAVSLAVSGTVVELDADVRRALTAPLVSALSAARGRARVSVLRTGEDVRVAVVADAGVEVVPAPRYGVRVECGVYGGHVRTEARWVRQGG